MLNGKRKQSIDHRYRLKRSDIHGQRKSSFSLKRFQMTERGCNTTQPFIFI